MSSSFWNIYELFSKITFPWQLSVSKRGTLFITTTAGLITLIATAIYMRRKRKPLPSINPDDHEDRNGNVVMDKKRRNRQKPRRQDGNSMNSSDRTQYRTRYRRDHSIFSESSTISSVKSSTSRQSRISHLPAPGTKEFYDAERLYRLGVDSFENAMSQWEKASSMLSNDASDLSTNQSGRSSSSSHVGVRQKRTTSIHSSGEMNHQKTQTSRSRKSSVSRIRSTLEGNSLPHKPDPILNDVATEDDVLENDQLDSSSASAIEHKLFLFMERAERLQKTFEEVLYSGSDTGSDTDITLTGYDDPGLSDFDSDAESFVSALEVWDTRSLDECPQQQRLTLYENALEAVDRGSVRCRTLRTELLDCFSDIEFLAKLHCVRQSLDLMLEDTTVRDWLLDSGRVTIELMLKSANHSTAQFKDSFSLLIEYVSNPQNWQKIEDELRGRKVVSMTFYDIVLDFIIMDSFDDLERPPSSVLSVLGNRWLANSIKETALSTAVWSVLKAKSRLLRCQDGFIAKFYAVSETISPLFAWGFLGPDEKLKSNCMKFKSEILLFLRGMFSFEQVRYTNVEQMSDDILNLAQQRMQAMLTYFETTMTR